MTGAGAEQEPAAPATAATVAEITLPLTSANLAAIGTLLVLAVLGAIYLHRILSRQSCTCALCSGQYVVLKNAGSGGFGQVFIVRDTVTAQTLCMKKIRVDDINMGNWAQSEAKKLRKLHHTHIVGYEDDFLHVQFLRGLEPQLYVCICMELCEGGDLKEFMQKKRDGFFDDGEPSFLETDEALRMLTEIADGIAYCHSRDVVHRDIKCHNVFLTHGSWSESEGGGRYQSCRLGDFGLSRQWSLGVVGGAPTACSPRPILQDADISSSASSLLPLVSPPRLRRRWRHDSSDDDYEGDSRATSPGSPIGTPTAPATAVGLPAAALTTAGTEFYRPPELFAGTAGSKSYDYFKVDVWCFGLLALELLTLTFTWERGGLPGACALQGDSHLAESLADVPRHFPRTLVDLVRLMLSRQPWQRPTARAVLDRLREITVQL